MIFLRSSQFARHELHDNAQFAAITEALRLHDSNVEAKHRVNVELLESVQTSQATMQTSLDDILRLRPAIEAGIAADVAADKARAEIEYRKKLARRVLAAIITTAATVGGLIPLAQWLASFHLHVGVS